MKVTIALFAYGGIDSNCLTSHMDLLAGVIKGNLPVKMFTIREDALISRSRCRATGQFLRDTGIDCTDVLVMIDHDIEFKAADLWQMASLAFDHQAIVGIPYPKRKLGAGSACRPEVHSDLSMSTLMQVQYLGAGCIAVPRGTIERIILHCKRLTTPIGISWCKDTICDFWTLWQPFVVGDEYLSEDYALCERAHAAGVPVYAWVGPILRHWGPHGFTLMPNRAVLPTTLPQDASEALPGPVIPPNDPNTLLR